MLSEPQPAPGEPPVALLPGRLTSVCPRFTVGDPDATRARGAPRGRTPLGDKRANHSCYDGILLTIRLGGHPMFEETLDKPGIKATALELDRIVDRQVKRHIGLDAHDPVLGQGPAHAHDRVRSAWSPRDYFGHHRVVV